VTFDEWLEEQPKSFKRRHSEVKQRASWEAGRIEGWIQADRVQKFQLGLNRPTYRIPQDLEILANS
jgi:hypothetical protein